MPDYNRVLQSFEHHLPKQENLVFLALKSILCRNNHLVNVFACPIQAKSTSDSSCKKKRSLPESDFHLAQAIGQVFM